MNLSEVFKTLLNISEIYDHYALLCIQILFQVLRDECSQKASFSSGHLVTWKKNITQNIFLPWELFRINFVFQYS